MLEEIFKDFSTSLANNEYDFLELERVDISHLNQIAEKIKAKHKNLIIIGVGASSLNIQVLTSALSKPSLNIVYLDCLDKLELEKKLQNIDLNNSIYFSISKSGNTHETYILTKYLIQEIKIPIQNFYIITTEGNNLLYELVKELNLNYFSYTPTLSGRFNIFSLSSLLPAIISGLDANKTIKSATKTIEQISLHKENILKEVRWYLENYSNKKKMVVYFNYSFQLEGFYRWQQQLIGESLGKNGFGITPVLAKGPFDEHTLLQLYLDGPDDKFYKIIYKEAKENFDNELIIHVNNVIKAFERKDRPFLEEKYQVINEELISEKVIKSMVIVILIAMSQNLNPFNQPYIEKYKIKINS